MNFLSAAVLASPRRLSDGRVVVRRRRGLAIVIEDRAMERRIRRRIGAAALVTFASLPVVMRGLAPLLGSALGMTPAFLLAAVAGGGVGYLAMQCALAGLPLREIPRDAAYADAPRIPHLGGSMLCMMSAWSAGWALVEASRFAVGGSRSVSGIALSTGGAVVLALAAWAILRREPEPSAFDEETQEGYPVG